MLIAGIWGGIKAWSILSLSGFKPTPVLPGEINLVAVEKGAGYRIIVSNGTAHLVEVSGDASFDAPDDNERADTQDAGRLPMREALKALQGDTDALGTLVMEVNKAKPDDLPPVQILWKSEDILKALDGDVNLRAKLEHDLNTKLNGDPLDTFNLDAVLNGIVIDSPVKVRVPLETETKELVCRIREPYKTLFAGSVQKMIDDRFNPTREAMIGFYRDRANTLIKEKRQENVEGSLRSRIDPKKLQSWAVGPEKILSNMTVLINENHMTGATADSYPGPDRSILSNVVIRLTDEGRMRLWKYSHDNPGFQLLLTMNGIAIAAPRIKTELAESEVMLTRVPSKELVQDAVDSINRLASGKKGK